MRIFALADLHLSFSAPKPMDIFGTGWIDHADTIRNNWQKNVSDSDIVLVPGDISWAMQLTEAKTDLDFIASLNGTKILLRGNHDYWWNSVTQLRSILDKTVYCIQNDCLTIEDFSFGGTRMWGIPNDDSTKEDIKIYRRELGRMKMSLDQMPTGKRRIVMLHFPPTNEKHEENELTKLMEEYEIETVVYGHLHAKSHYSAFNGVLNGVRYQLCACDYLGFKPIQIV